MTDLDIFDYAGKQVRTVVIDGEPWFVAADVTAALGLRNGRDAIARLDEAGVGDADIRSGGQLRRVAVISEPGLYELIFQSRVDGARDFRRWVTGEVLPTIRRTGSYALPQTREQRIAAALVDATDMLTEAHQQIAVLEPAATAWNELAAADGDYSVGDAAKILARAGVETGQQRLFTQMQVLRMVYRGAADRKWRAYQAAVDAGHLTELPQTHRHPQTGVVVVDAPQVRVTARGIEHLRKRLGVLRPVDLELPDGEATA